MVTLKARQTIIRLYLKEASEREISRKATKAKNNVRKYIKQ